MAFRLISSQPVYRGRVLSLRIDQVQTPAGQTVQLEVVEHTGAVTLVPVDADGSVWFVRQYRHSAGQALLELPAGTVNPGEDPAVCADRELREEIGMTSGQLSKLGEFFLAPGYSTEYMHVYLATDLTPAALPGDEDEFLSIEKFPLPRAMEMARTGALRDAKSIAALMLVGGVNR